jgi:hypothetical protein
MKHQKTRRASKKSLKSYNSLYELKKQYEKKNPKTRRAHIKRFNCCVVV